MLVLDAVDFTDISDANGTSRKYDVDDIAELLDVRISC